MKTLLKIQNDKLPFDWLDTTYLRNSDCLRKEIYLTTESDFIYGLKDFFYAAFGTFKDNLVLSNVEWGYFCLDTWNVHTDEYDVSLKGKSEETVNYLIMLVDSGIETNYEGLCKCDDWESFLDVILPCILHHVAPYSPFFYDAENEYMFYFHHTNSIGLLYKEENDGIRKIIDTSIQKGCEVI